MGTPLGRVFQVISSAPDKHLLPFCRRRALLIAGPAAAVQPVDLSPATAPQPAQLQCTPGKTGPTPSCLHTLSLAWQQSTTVPLALGSPTLARAQEWLRSATGALPWVRPPLG